MSRETKKEVVRLRTTHSNLVFFILLFWIWRRRRRRRSLGCGVRVREWWVTPNYNYLFPSELSLSLSLSLSADFNFLSNRTFSFSCEAIKASFLISVLALEFGKKWRSVDISYVSFCLGFYFAFLLNCCFFFFFFFFAFAYLLCLSAT